jgi:AbrB family looped-hinge helix DNA binding protein
VEFIRREQTRLSTRGQVVIPKVIRDHAQLTSGDELEVTYDGEVITLWPVGSREGIAAEDDDVRESRVSYRAGSPPSQVWAQRLRALGRLKRLQEQVKGIEVDLSELLTQSREELEGRGKGE